MRMGYIFLVFSLVFIVGAGCTPPVSSVKPTETISQDIESIVVLVSGGSKKTIYKFKKMNPKSYTLLFHSLDKKLSAEISQQDFQRFFDEFSKKQEASRVPCEQVSIHVNFLNGEGKSVDQNQACEGSSQGQFWLRLLKGAHASFVA